MFWTIYTVFEPLIEFLYAGKISSKLCSNILWKIIEMILGNLKYLSIQKTEFSNICLGKYIIYLYLSGSKSGRVAEWSKATSKNHSQ